MEKVWDHLIAGIHASGKQAVMAITGGGSGAVGRVLRVPGGSQLLLEAVVPYGAAALVDFLGGPADQYCSEKTARSMAMAAWVRARRLAGSVDPHCLVGIGATASLVSDKPKKGEHRIHVAVQSADKTATLSVTLAKGARNRKEEERLAGKLVIIALAEACGVDAAAARERMSTRLGLQETIEHRSRAAEPAWTRLLVGEAASVGSDMARRARVLFPGAFNPLHRGHVKMAELAAAKLGAAVVYELSIMNVDKPPLDFVEISERLRSIEEQDPTREVLLTAAPTFREKARLVPGATFVVGADTLVRIGEAKYYGGNEGRRDEAMAELGRLGCRFLVFGRQVGQRFLCLGDVEVPGGLRALCEEVSEAEFHEDVSSTELRKKN